MLNHETKTLGAEQLPGEGDQYRLASPGHLSTHSLWEVGRLWPGPEDLSCSHCTPHPGTLPTLTRAYLCVWHPAWEEGWFSKGKSPKEICWLFNGPYLPLHHHPAPIPPWKELADPLLSGQRGSLKGVPIVPLSTDTSEKRVSSPSLS